MNAEKGIDWLSSSKAFEGFPEVLKLGVRFFYDLQLAPLETVAEFV